MSACADFQKSRLHRRTLMRIGSLGLAGLGLPNLLRREAVASSDHLIARAKSVIFLHQCGGPSHIDTFDMKPNAPDGIRGEFRSIASSVPGLRVCEHLPRWADTLHYWGQVRSVHHRMKNHNSAGYYCLTGHAPPSDDIRIRDTLDLFPAYGSIVAQQLGPTAPGIPPFVSYPHNVRDGSITPGQHASFLGKPYDPFFFQADPNAKDFRLGELQLPESINLERLSRRRELMNVVDNHRRLADRMAEVRGWDDLQQQAFSMLTSPALQRAFDLSSEPDRLRDAYGRTNYGQSCLLARRLIECGVRFVTVYFAQGIGGAGSEGWDTHQENFKDLKSRLLPITDQTVPTLIADLQQRGLLDDTLVLWMGEFGRGPKIGDRDGKGRGHWPECYTVMMAGGGVQGGSVYGASDHQGAYPAENPVGPEDITATLYWALGIDPQAEIFDTQKRPLPLTTGSPIMDLF
jgi:Protein of unknown function (DUF1501)